MSTLCTTTSALCQNLQDNYGACMNRSRIMDHHMSQQFDVICASRNPLSTTTIEASELYISQILSASRLHESVVRRFAAPVHEGTPGTIDPRSGNHRANPSLMVHLGAMLSLRLQCLNRSMRSNTVAKYAKYRVLSGCLKACM